MKKLMLAALVVLSCVPARAALKTQVIEYSDGDVVLQGYAAWEDAFKGPRPGIAVFHEWMGHGPYVRRRAEQLAGMGYVAFSADMYGKGVFAKDHEEAGKRAGVFFKDRALMRGRAAAALEELKKLPNVDKTKLAAMGYCFGGATSLELARMGADLKGVVSFHGSLETPAPAEKKPTAKILVLHGADDSFVGKQVPGFIDEMKKVGADWEMDSYGGAVHSFSVAEAGSDASKGMAYNKAADERSWKRMRHFFIELFGPEGR